MDHRSEDGTILGSRKILSESGNPESVVIPLSIELVRGNIHITGDTTGGIVVEGRRRKAKSARDRFVIVLDPVDGHVKWARLRRLVWAPPIAAAVQNSAAAGEGSETMAGAQSVGAFLGNFEATAFAKWTQSKVLSFLEVKKNPTATALGEVNTQLAAINSRLLSMDKKLTEYLGDFACIYEAILEQNTLFSKGVADTYETNIKSFWDSYVEAVNDADPNWTPDPNNSNAPDPNATMQMVLEKPTSFVNTFTPAYMTNMNNNLSKLIGTATGSGGVPASMYKQMQTTVEELKGCTSEMKVGCTSTLGFASGLNGYNEGLMNYYATLIQSMQVVYTIQSTFLKVASTVCPPATCGDPNNPSKYQGWTIGIGDLLNDASYGENQNNLNIHYQQLIQTTFNNVAQYVISDEYDDLPSRAKTDGFQVEYQPSGCDPNDPNSPGYDHKLKKEKKDPCANVAHLYYPLQAKTLPGMPPVGTDPNDTPPHAWSWFHACNIYVWNGVAADPNTVAFSGKCGNNQFQVEYPLVGGDPNDPNDPNDQQPGVLDLTNIQPDSAGINYCYLPHGLQGKAVSQLQPAPPATWSTQYLDGVGNKTAWNNSPGFGQMAVKGRYGTIWQHNLQPWPTSTKQLLSGPVATPVSWMSTIWDEHGQPADAKVDVNTTDLNYIFPYNTYTGRVIFSYVAPSGLHSYFALVVYGADENGPCYYDADASTNNLCVAVQCGNDADSNICAQDLDTRYLTPYTATITFAGPDSSALPQVSACTFADSHESGNLEAGSNPCPQ